MMDPSTRLSRLSRLSLRVQSENSPVCCSLSQPCHGLWAGTGRTSDASNRLDLARRDGGRLGVLKKRKVLSSRFFFFCVPDGFRRPAYSVHGGDIHLKMDLDQFILQDF